MQTRFFKNPITLLGQEDIDNAFYTACIIHNMILKHDGLDTLWEDGLNWNKIDPNGNEDEDEVEDEDIQPYQPTMHDPATFVPTYVHDLIPPEERREYLGEKEDFEKLRDLLANHLQILYREGGLR